MAGWYSFAELHTFQTDRSALEAANPIYVVTEGDAPVALPSAPGLIDLLELYSAISLPNRFPVLDHNGNPLEENGTHMQHHSQLVDLAAGEPFTVDYEPPLEQGLPDSIVRRFDALLKDTEG